MGEVKIVVEGTTIEVPFKELSQEFQKKLYLDNPEQFQNKAAQSEYYIIRAMVAKKTNSSEVLKDLVMKEFQRNKMGDEQVVYAVFSNKSFKLDDEISRAFFNWRSTKFEKHKTSLNMWVMINMIAKDESTSQETLKYIVLNGFFNSIKILENVLENPNFKLDDETRNVIEKTGTEEVKEMVAKKEQKD